MEKFEVVGYRQEKLYENDSTGVWCGVATRIFDQYPTDKEIELFCKEYNLERIAIRKTEAIENIYDYYAD